MNWSKCFSSLKTCIIVPTYNNGTTLNALLVQLLSFTDQIIIINDGSTDNTSNILAEFSQLTILNNKTNRGKGWSLRRGLDTAFSLGFDYAITIDSDGQHFPEDLPKFLGAIQLHPHSIIIGKRNMRQDGIPRKSSFGNNFSNFWFWVCTGIKIEDTQSGYRLYPLKRLHKFKWITRGFETEIEIIVRSSWAGIKIEAVPVKIHYEKENRITHFRPFIDITRISLLNTVFVILSLFYFTPKRLITNLLLNRKKWKELLGANDSPKKKAFSVALGICIGIMPIWGFQIIVAMLLSILLKLNKPLVLIAVNISIPPFLPFIIYLSHRLGGFLLGKPLYQFDWSKSFSFENLPNQLLQYTYGAIVLSLLSGCMAFLITWSVLKIKNSK